MYFYRRAVANNMSAANPHAYYKVPPEDLSEFAKLPSGVREEVADKLAAFEYFVQSKSVRAGARAVECERRSKSAALG